MRDKELVPITGGGNPGRQEAGERCKDRSGTGIISSGHPAGFDDGDYPRASVAYSSYGCGWWDVVPCIAWQLGRMAAAAPLVDRKSGV